MSDLIQIPRYKRAPSSAAGNGNSQICIRPFGNIIKIILFGHIGRRGERLFRIEYKEFKLIFSRFIGKCGGKVYICRAYRAVRICRDCACRAHSALVIINRADDKRALCSVGKIDAYFNVSRDNAAVVDKVIFRTYYLRLITIVHDRKAYLCRNRCERAVRIFKEQYAVVKSRLIMCAENPACRISVNFGNKP